MIVFVLKICLAIDTLELTMNIKNKMNELPEIVYR